MSRRHEAPAMLLKVPAVEAVFIQLAAALATFAMAAGLAAVSELQVSIGACVLIQGAMAASLAGWRGMAPWWLVIHLVFPIALLAVLAAHLPPGIFLAGFCVLVAWYWSAFRTQVPFYPSRPAVWREVAQLLPAGGLLRFVDIGSGLGGLVVELARIRPEGRYTGIEIAPLPWLVSRTRAALAKLSVRFLRGDYESLHLGEYDIVFAYLSPAAMPSLWAKAKREMRPGSVLLSLEFPVPGVPPHRIIYPAGHEPALYVWNI